MARHGNGLHGDDSSGVTMNVQECTRGRSRSQQGMGTTASPEAFSAIQTSAFGDRTHDNANSPPAENIQTISYNSRGLQRMWSFWSNFAAGQRATIKQKRDKILVRPACPVETNGHPAGWPPSDGFGPHPAKTDFLLRSSVRADSTAPLPRQLLDLDGLQMIQQLSR